MKFFKRLFLVFIPFIFTTQVHTQTSPTYGTTIITHGFIQGGSTSFESDWMFSMAKEIVNTHKGNVFRYNTKTGKFDKSPISTSDNGETVLIFDWSLESNFDGKGFSEAAGDALFAALMRSGFSLNNLHFIGHSRGTVVNTECVLRLLTIGIPVDHVTNLDPHDWGGGTIGPDFDNHPELPEISFPGDAFLKHCPGVISWERVNFIDTYYQLNGAVILNSNCNRCIGALEGRAVEGSFNRLWEEDISDNNKKICHTNIHECVYTKTIKNPQEKITKENLSGGYIFSRLGGGASYRQLVKGRVPISSSFNFIKRDNFNRIKGIVNGDFERLGISRTNTPGWGINHGGGGNATYKYINLSNNNYVKIGRNEFIRHNFFYLPKEAEGINFKFRNNIKSGSVFKVIMNNGNTVYPVFEKKLETLNNDFETLFFPLNALKGGIFTMEFRIDGNLSADVDIDDIEFGKALNKNASLFLFDVSGSMNEAGKSGNSKIIEAKGAAITTLGNLNQTNSSSQPYVAIKTFSGACSQDPTNPILDYTSDLKQAENAIMSIPMPNGGTPLPQAIEVSKADLLKCLKSNNQKQGKLIILSDGQSSCGAIRPPDIYGKNPVIVTNPQGTVANPLVKNYAIGFNIPPGSEAERDLQYLAQMSGGKYVNAQDQLELTKAFQKFSRVYVPKPYPTIDTLSSTFKILFAKGINSIEDEEFDKALESYKQFTKNTPKDCNGFYNLALMYEANEYFKAAIKNYETYLQLCPNPQDKDYVRKQIESLNIEHDKYVEYNKKIVMSDLDYLNLHFKKIQNGESVALAVEFIGFISEKWIYYRNLAEIIESDDRLFKTNANEVFKGLKECVETIKRNPQAWDRDATPVLSRTYLNMERLIKSF